MLCQDESIEQKKGGIKTVNANDGDAQLKSMIEPNSNSRISKFKIAVFRACCNRALGRRISREVV